MGETLNILFRVRDDGTYEVQVKESWSGRTVSGTFLPPYSGRQLNALQKKLSTLDSRDHELREIGQRLFAALSCHDPAIPMTVQSDDTTVQGMLKGVIQRTLKRRGTVALMLGFHAGCEEFVRYPWELLHNGDHFLLVSGVFTLSRVLLRPDSPVGCELPVHPPFRVLYISSSPSDCAPLETERSFEAMEQALTPLIDAGQILLDRLEPPTFSQLVRYLSSYGGAGMLDDSDTTVPCYVIHFDGHGAYGRFCPEDDCETMNEPEARKCRNCGTSLNRCKPQTYLCFCDEGGQKHFIDTQSLRDLLLSSDVRLAVFAACETATITSTESLRTQRTVAARPAVDATLATALVTGQVPAVVAMPFSLQDDLSPTFMYHFYEALADGRTLEEALSRARQALLPMQQKSWFIPVLYRHVAEDEGTPVPLITIDDGDDEHAHPLAYLGPPATFVGRQQELKEITELLTIATAGEQKPDPQRRTRTSQHPFHHIAFTGPAGIGKSALAFEAIRRNRDKFPGAILGVSLQDNKSFADALLEMIQHLHIPLRTGISLDVSHRTRLVQGTLRSLASRELPCLLLLDSFEEVKDRGELETWLHFLTSLPQEVIVLVTSRSNPEHMLVMGGQQCRWYEYRVKKMTETELLNLFVELAAESGLDQHIHLEEPRQQTILREICTLLDGYPLGAELIFGTARSIDGRVYTPEAATRSLEEVRDELREIPLAGILAVLEISYRRLTPLAQLLFAYLSAFKLPFNREQIRLLVAPDTLAAASSPILLTPPLYGHLPAEVLPATLIENWRAARDELVQASLIQFDGTVYTIHSQVRHFALIHLPQAERHRVHRVVAAYYYNLTQPTKDEWFAAFEHLEAAGEPQDLREAIQVAVRASWALGGRGHAPELQAMLRRAAVHASRLKDRTGEGQIQCCLGAILRQMGQHAEAEAYLRSSLSFHRQHNDASNSAWTLYELARLFCESGDFSQASTCAQEALDLFQAGSDCIGEAWVQLVLGDICRGYDRTTEALTHFARALSTFQERDDREGWASTLYARGMVYTTTGNFALARHNYEEALNLFTSLGLRIGLAWTRAGTCVLYKEQGQLELAEQAGKEAMALFREQRIRRGEAWTLCWLGDTLSKKPDLVQAREYYQEAYTLLNTLGDRIGLAHLLNAQGALAFSEGDYLEAKDTYERASIIARDYGARLLTCQALRGLGDVECIMQNYGQAEHAYTEAATLAAALGLPSERSAVLVRQGQLCVERKHYREALDYWLQALALEQQLEHPSTSHLQSHVDALVTAQHLEETYAALRAR